MLKYKTGALKIQDAYYFHNGKVETTTKIAKEIFGDYKKHGIPFLDKQFKNLQESKTIIAGINYIDNLSVDKNDLKLSIETSINSTKYGRIDNSVYDELKKILYATLIGRNKEIRNSIPKTARELLELYWTK
jgi:hypothetical protein